MGQAAGKVKSLTDGQRQLVEQNIALAKHIARRFTQSRTLMLAADPATGPDDIISAAYLGLCDAARRFEPARGFQFSTFAVHSIRGAILRYLRDLAQPGGMRVPRRLLADERPKVTRLDYQYNDDGDGPLTLAGLLEAPDDVEGEALVEATLSTLPERLRTVMRLRVHGHTQKFVARTTGVSQVQVSRLEQQAVKVLRRQFETGGNRMILSDKQRKILAAMDSLPAAAPIKRIRETAGVDVAVPDMKPLVSAGWVKEVDRPEPPLLGFTLTAEGRAEAARVRQAHHPDIRTPEMGKGVPEAALRDRVTKEMLKSALQEGRTVAWMSLKFDASAKGLQELIEEYGLQNTPEVQRVQVDPADAEPQQPPAKRPANIKDRKDELYALFAQGKCDERTGRTAIAEEWGCSPTTIDYHYAKWVKAGRPGVVPAAPGVVTDPGAGIEATVAVVEGQVTVVLTEGDQILEHRTATEPGAWEGLAAKVEQAAEITQEFDETFRRIQEVTGADPEEMVSSEGAAEQIAPENGEQTEAPATPEQLEALKNHFASGGAAHGLADKPGARTGKSDQLKVTITATIKGAVKLPEEGKVYEGVVHRVEEKYALIHLTELYDGRGWPRGKCSWDEIPLPAGCDDVRDALKEGDLVNVKALKVSQATWGDKKLYITLSVTQAPPHDQEPAAIREGRAAGQERPTTDRGAEVVATMQTGEVTATPVRLEKPSREDWALDHARQLLRQHALDDSHLPELKERILANGLPETRWQVTADRLAMVQFSIAEDLGRQVGPEEVDLLVEQAELGAELRREAMEELRAEVAEAAPVARPTVEDLRHASLQTEICMSCSHRHVCMFRDWSLFAEPIDLTKEDLASAPPRARGVNITLSRRFVQECSAYQRE